MNKICLVGRLVANPEKKSTETGNIYCRFRLAVNRVFSNSQGEKETDFINIIAWKKQAENVYLYLKKGSLISIEGRIQTGSYTDQDGNKRYLTDVVADHIQFLESKEQSQNKSLPVHEPVTSSYQQQSVSPYDFHNQSKEYIYDTVELDDNFLG